MSIAGAGAEDAFDVGSEADIEHAISFIENGDGEVFEVEVSASHEIQNAAWGTDDDLGAVAKVVDLFSHGSAADGEREADGCTGGEFFGFEADLFAEFAGGCEHEHLDVGEVVVDLFERGEHEGGGLAGARTGLSDAVFAGECDRNESRLDGAWGFVADFAEGTKSGGRETEVLEGGVIGF